MTWLLDEEDLEVLQSFVQQPELFASGDEKVSALQTEQNPFGDYAPKSTQVQGILSSMYDNFQRQLKLAKDEEAKRQKSFDDLSATKRSELANLQAGLLAKQTGKAEREQKLSETQTLLKDTTKQLEADRTLNTEAQDSYRTKSIEFAERAKLRADELAGVKKALEFLNSDAAKKTFQSASKGAMLVQLKATSHSSAKAELRSKTLTQLQDIAQRHGLSSVFELAHEVRGGEKFEKVLKMVDKMIELLRTEERDDIAHRDRCADSTAKNVALQDTLKFEKEKADKEMAQLLNLEKEAQASNDKVSKATEATKKEMSERSAAREKEHAELQKALKDNQDSVELVKKAVESLAAFYKKNKISMAQLEEDAEADPAKKEAQKEAPKTWDKAYTGGQGKDIVGILEMIATDINKEIAKIKEQDKKGQAEFDKDINTMQAALKAQKETAAATAVALADVQRNKASKQTFLSENANQITAAKEMQKSLKDDCKWVETSFDSRREKRQAELAGLNEAKNALAGVAAGNFAQLDVAVAR